MKIVLLVLCTFALAVNVRGESDSSATQSFRECLAENDINEDDMKDLEQRKDPKIRCVMACLLEKEGILKNGEIDKNSLIKETLKAADKLSEQKVTELVNNCVDLAKDLDDICDQSNAIGICLSDELHKIGMEMN